jgi:Protein of unknown function (DUF1488)
MTSKFELETPRYDPDRRAVVCSAKTVTGPVVCLVTAEALNDRLKMNAEGEQLLVLFERLREEIRILAEATYKLGNFTTPGEIWLTTKELYR